MVPVQRPKNVRLVAAANLVTVVLDPNSVVKMFASQTVMRKLNADVSNDHKVELNINSHCSSLCPSS